jgi:predicted O-linked N-acetylglucosamine transferase (SPINDLY family)
MNINEIIQLAVQHYQFGNLQQAEQCFKKVLEQEPNNPEILYFLGIISAQSDNYNSAIHYMKRSLHFNSGNADAYLALGIALQQTGLIDDAIRAFENVIQMNPNSAEAYFNLGNILKQKGQLDDAIAYFYKTVEMNPDFIHAYHGLAGALVTQWRLDEVITVCQRMLHMNPSDMLAYYILGNTLMTQGKLDEAEVCFRQAIQINPNELKSFQALLMLTSYHPKFDPLAILSEHLHFAKQFADPLSSKFSPHTNDRTVNKRLKIGYVSPDFKAHAVVNFIEPILMSHNRDHFEIFCYSDVSSPDEVTNRIEKHADQWRSVVGMSYENVAGLIRKDGIDILIDLAGHTGGINRILLFAYKPAPVQVTWIGYPSTTGLETIDYKIVDKMTDPVGTTEQYYAERLIRLPETFLCYLPDKDIPHVSHLPAFSAGHITFGSFNNFVKITPEVIALWSRILKIVPNSHLIMKSLSFFDKTTTSYARTIFLREGIEAATIEFLQPLASMTDHLELYNHIDIGLDTFPYNGTTTTCEALWMGVPVITLAGKSHASRVGVSLLSNVGLPELIATTPEEYVAKAVNLARDPEKLQSLRKCLRDMMSHSPLTDAKKFTHQLEEAYRKMWRTWCIKNE